MKTASPRKIGAEAMQASADGTRSAFEKETLRHELRETNSEAKRKKLVKRLKLIESFVESGSKPEWMVLDVCRSSRQSCARWCRWMVAVSRRLI